MHLRLLPSAAPLRGSASSAPATATVAREAAVFAALADQAVIVARKTALDAAPPRSPEMIVETSANLLFQVRETNSANLSHVWFGIPVKRVKGGFAPKAGATERLIRKAGSRVIA